MNDPRRNDPTITFEELRNRVVLNGDVEAYYDLKISYYDRDYSQEILFYSILMANKYDYDQAYYDVFLNLTNIYYHNGWQIDDVTAELAMNYLFKAAEIGHRQATDETKKVIDSGITNSAEQVRFLYHMN